MPLLVLLWLAELGIAAAAGRRALLGHMVTTNDAASFLAAAQDPQVDEIVLSGAPD